VHLPDTFGSSGSSEIKRQVFFDPAGRRARIINALFLLSAILIGHA
jgi:hypothetical protein